MQVSVILALQAVSVDSESHFRLRMSHSVLVEEETVEVASVEAVFKALEVCCHSVDIARMSMWCIFFAFSSVWFCVWLDEEKSVLVVSRFFWRQLQDLLKVQSEIIDLATRFLRFRLFFGVELPVQPLLGNDLLPFACSEFVSKDLSFVFQFVSVEVSWKRLSFSLFGGSISSLLF